MPSVIAELAIVILIATTLGIIARLLKQPLILAFILTGVLISYFGFFHIDNKEVLQLFSDLGIMFLLFLVGLEIDFRSLKLISKPSLIIGAFQIILTFIFSFLLSQYLHFNNLQAAYISLALSFSSTIIVIKLLSEKKDTNSLYGKITTGVLLIQDFMAILILVALSGIKAGQGIIIGSLILTIIKGVVLSAAVLLIGRKFLPLVFNKISHSQELLFLSSLAWCFLLAAIVSHPKIGFPIEISGLLAGLALSNSSENFQISSKIKYLRDFFVLIFFVILGSSLVFSGNSAIVAPVIAFSLLVLIGKPLIIMITMGLLGYRKKTGFLTGITVSQISEFSLVLVAIGYKLGHLTKEVSSIITAVGIATISVSVYSIVFVDKIFEKISPVLSIFQRRKLKEEYSSDHSFSKPIILIGSHRLGQSIAFNLKKEDVLIVDFDPEVINQVKSRNYDYLFGDITDEEIFERANFDNANLVISAIPDLKDNLKLLQRLNLLKKDGAKMKIIVRANNENEVKLLYGEGVDYVIYPHFTSGQYLGKIISIDPEMKIIDELRSWDLKTIQRLEQRSHPR